MKDDLEHSEHDSPGIAAKKARLRHAAKSASSARKGKKKAPGVKTPAPKLDLPVMNSASPDGLLPTPGVGNDRNSILASLSKAIKSKKASMGGPQVGTFD